MIRDWLNLGFRVALIIGALALCWLGLKSPAPAGLPQAQATDDAESSLQSTATPRQQADRSRINLNTATLSEIKSLPGIGPVLGQRIIDQRERQGTFKRTADLIIIKGIGERKFRDLEDLVCVN